MFKVFVYGSLKNGFHNAHFLENSKYLGEAAITGSTLYDMGISFPCIKVDGSENVVYGELYGVDEEALEQLDHLEGYSEDSDYNLYERVVVKARLKNGCVYNCYTYEWAKKERATWKKIEKWERK